MTALDWTPIIVSFLSGTGLIGLWLKTRADERRWQRELAEQQRQWNLEREEQQRRWELERRQLMEEARRHDEVDRLNAKTALRQAADGMAEKIWERLGVDLEKAGMQLDDARNLIERQQAEIKDLLTRLDTASGKLIEVERKLAAADAEISRKERVIVQLQEQVVMLEATIAELRKQLAECTARSGDD